MQIYSLPVVFSGIRVLEVIQNDCDDNNNYRKEPESFSESVV